MIRKTLLFICVLIILVGATSFAFAQKIAQPISIVGCYSDLIERNGNIIGNGIIKIKKENGKYFGTFAELRNELGLTDGEKFLENLKVDESKRILTFTIEFSRYVGTKTRKLEMVRKIVTGKITNAGIKINWNGYRTDYGNVNPFMKREKDCQ